MSPYLHCKFCENLNDVPVLPNGLEWLERSVQHGCTFCNVLRSGIAAFANNSAARQSIKEQYDVDIPPFGQLSPQTGILFRVSKRRLALALPPGDFSLEIHTSSSVDADGDSCCTGLNTVESMCVLRQASPARLRKKGSKERVTSVDEAMLRFAREM